MDRYDILLIADETILVSSQDNIMYIVQHCKYRD